MDTYFAVCNVNGPISIEITAESQEDAVAHFERLDAQRLIDDAQTDADDDLDIDGTGMTEAEFADELESHGCECVLDLSPIVNGHSMRSDHLAGGWMLWKKL